MNNSIHKNINRQTGILHRLRDLQKLIFDF